MQWPLIGGLLATFGTGLWLKIGFSHFKAPAVLLGFAVVVFAVFLWEPALMVVDDVLVSIAGGDLAHAHRSWATPGEIGMAIGMLLPTAAGMILASALRPVGAWGRRSIFRSLLSRARKRRRGE